MSTGKRRRLLLATVLSALGTLGLQLLALVTLTPEPFGHFSMLYLVQAFLFSLQLSIVSEAWVRRQREVGTPSTWAEYAGASLTLAAVGGAAGALVAVATGEGVLVALAAGTAVFAATYRSGARFYAVRRGEWSHVIPGDAAAAAVTLAALAAGVIRPDDFGNLKFVASVWALSMVVSSLLSRHPSVAGLGSLPHWVRHHRQAVAPLLRDSLVMDVSSIGTPYALAPVLGVANFGIYRGVSNVAAPVRMILNPLRAEFAKWSPSRMRSPRVGLLILASSGTLGVLAGVALLMIGITGLELGTLSALVPFYVPAGIFVAGNFVNHAYYLFSRQIASPRAMLAARIWQTVILTVAPIVGALCWGLTGAIWLFAVGTVVSSAGWATAVRH